MSQSIHPSAGSPAPTGSDVPHKILECEDWMAECRRQYARGKPVLALGVVKCLQMSLEELAKMLGQPQSPNAQPMSHGDVKGPNET